MCNIQLAGSGEELPWRRLRRVTGWAGLRAMKVNAFET